MIESYAAPVQSYRRKRSGEGPYLVLQSYLGAGVGWERAADQREGFLGTSAPVGIELGWPKDSWSFGFFAQLLDVGALASVSRRRS